MNLEQILNIGATVSKEYIVKSEHTADVLGNIGVKVLSTPAMITFMEATASQIVFYKIDEQYRPVGTKINIEHINPTPINMKVTVHATLVKIDGKRLAYQVEAFNEKSKIGFGTYEQYVINLNDFLGL